MAGLSAADVLHAWDWGRDRDSHDRALVLLSFGWLEPDWEQLPTASIGQRDRRLLDLREQTMGPTLNLYVECPRCATRLESRLATADLRTGLPGPPPDSNLLYVQGDLSISYRLPNSADLRAIAMHADVDSARHALLERCVQRASRGGSPVDVDALTPDEVGVLAKAMEERDPQAEVLLTFTCPACQYGWQALFDVAEFFWTEIASASRRLLREVDALAGAYGWSEAAILALSPARRHAYMEMVGA